MKIFLLPIVLFICGCASTTIYENGTPVFKTQADITDLTFTTSRTTFHVGAMNHSNATLAGGEAAANVIGSAGTFVGSVGAAIVTSGLAESHPTTAALAVAAPVVVTPRTSKMTIVQPSPTPSR